MSGGKFESLGFDFTPWGDLAEALVGHPASRLLCAIVKTGVVGALPVLSVKPSRLTYEYFEPKYEDANIKFEHMGKPLFSPCLLQRTSYSFKYQIRRDNG